MSHVVSTTTGYRNLQSYSHVYQPVTTVGTSTDSISYDPAQYRRIILLDMDETERDNLWIREEIRRVLVQNELLRHRFRYSQVDEERKRAYEIERRRREEEERRRWEEELARRRLEDEERRRMEDELRRRQDEDRRRLDEDRRRLEAERRRLEDEERAKLMELQHKPVAMGRFPDPGDIVQVSVMRGEELRQMGRYAPIYVKVGFDGQPSLPYRTKSAFNSGEPVWEETLPDMYMPLGARHLAVEVYEDEAKDHLIGTGKLDLRYDENTIHHVDVVNRSGERQGKVFLRYNSRHPPPPPPPPVPLPSVSQGEMGPLMDIEIVEASNLVDLDIIGKSDPYVQLCWGNDTKPFYTTKVSKGKNPVWKEAVRGVRIPAGVQYITINVWDEDPGKDDFMGTHRLLLSPPPDGDTWLPLHARENEPKDAKLAKKGNLGVINLRVKCRQGRLDSAYVPPPSPSPTPSKAGVATLDLEVIEGRDLVDLDIIGKSDPYVQFCWGTDPKPFYTTKVSKGKNPVWREGVKGLRIPDGTQFISLLVWDEDPGKDDFMGVHRLRLVPPPNGDMWLKLYPRENEPQDAKLVKKGNLGEINIRVKCTGVRRGSGPLPMPEPLSLTGPVPTRCRVTLIGAEGLAPADSNGLSDPYATISVGYEIASKEHKTSAKKKTLNPIWNETFDLHVPENETHLTFNVWDDDKLSKDDFLGQAGLDVRGPMRQNGAFFLPLRPRANNADDQKLVSEHGGLGKIRFKTEWVGLPTTVPASPTFQTASSQTSVPPSPAHQPAPIPRPPSEVVAPPPAPKPAPPPAPKPAPPSPPKPVEPPAQTFEEVSVW